MKIFLLILCLAVVNTDPIRQVEEVLTIQNITFSKTRRILGGHEAGETRPYMVYLRPAAGATINAENSNWLCGGVIIHERYILTSAACIEDAKQFYVVSGTHRYIPTSDTTDECITHGAKKAVWKCIPKSYYFDGHEFDNIRWMVRDIAVVKVEDDFNFKRRIRGCDFVPSLIAYNNISDDLENPGKQASVAGWGTTNSFIDEKDPTDGPTNSPELLEADVVIISRKSCKSRWDPRYHHVIDENMICAKDIVGADMSALCTPEVNCTELMYSMEEEEAIEGRRYEEERQRVIRGDAPVQSRQPNVLLASQPVSKAVNKTRREMGAGGGFCENDHGGPLVVGRGKSAVVIGVVSASQTDDTTHKCHGPFLYTSVYLNRHLINCAITKDIGSSNKVVIRSGSTENTTTTVPAVTTNHTYLPSKIL